jgi:hypothetical protein
MTREVMVGACRVRFEPPDTIVEEVVGDITYVEAQGILAAAAELMEGLDEAYVLGDISRVGTITASARSAVGQARTTPNVPAYAVVGASQRMRVLAMLILKGAALIRKQKAEIRFFESQDQARAWFAELREKRRQSNDSGR